MRIKRLTAVMLSAVMAIGMCACTAQEKKVESAPFDEATYIETITKEVVGNLAQLSKDEAYIAIYSNEEDVVKIAKEWGNLSADFTKGYYEITDDENAMDTALQELGEDDELGNLGDFSKAYLKSRFAGSLSSYVNSRGGVDYVVLSSVLNYSRTYVPKEQISDRIRIIPTQDDNTFYFVNFANTGDGALTVTATHLFCAGDLEEEFKDTLGITLTKTHK